VLLGDWEKTLTRLIKVVPLEYRRVLEEQSRARERGSSPQVDVLQAGAK
jgi:glutamate synthase domain-containing protein 3